MPFFKCIFKDLLTNLNVRFCFFSKRDSWKPPTYQTKLTSFEKNCHILRRSLNKVKSRKQIGKNFCSFLFMLNFGNQFPFRILFCILSVIIANCNLIISVMAAWSIKFTEGSNSGKSTHYLSIYLQRIKKPKGRHMRRRGDRGGPLIENGRTKWTNKWRLVIKILIRGIIKSY
jgi:hypothetical protein